MNRYRYSTTPNLILLRNEIILAHDLQIVISAKDLSDLQISALPEEGWHLHFRQIRQLFLTQMQIALHLLQLLAEVLEALC